MATMFPPQLLPQTQNGEKQVFHALEALPDNWIVLHDIWENYRDTEGEYINYEADFIVLIPNRGIVVIEVKDWNETRINQGTWEHKIKGKWISMGPKNSPLNQAWCAKDKLIRGLVAAGVLAPGSRNQPEHRVLAILTKQLPINFGTEPSKQDLYIMSRCGNQPLDSLYICGSDDLEPNRLRDRLESLFCFDYPNGNMNQRTIEAIVAHLRPTLLFRLDLTQYLKEMEASSGHLLSILPALEGSTEGIMVSGCAGSGKTYMATQELLRQARTNALTANGRKLLFLSFSRNLAVTTRHLLDEQLGASEREGADAYNFHDICVRFILRPNGQEHLLNPRSAGEILSTEAFDFIRPRIGEQFRYDAIFVDEAQDFRDEWWPLVESMLTPGGKLYIFEDENQRIFADRPRLHPMPPTRLTLSKNLRNTYAIAAFAASLLPRQIQPHPLPIQGDPVQLMDGSDSPEERARMAEKCIRTIYARHPGQVRPCDIAVLTPWSIRNDRCSLPLISGVAAAVPKETPDEANRRHARCRDWNSLEILGDTIKGFKGLESPFVILTDIPALGESAGFTMNDFYVGCTRARYGLYIIPTLSGATFVRERLEQATAASAGNSPCTPAGEASNPSVTSPPAAE